MATKLEKDVTRETSVMVEDKEILITMTTEQKIDMRLKGQRGGEVISISIEDLYKKLVDTSSGESTTNKSDDTMISLGHLRDKFLIADIPYEQKVVFSTFVRGILNKKS